MRQKSNQRIANDVARNMEYKQAEIIVHIGIGFSIVLSGCINALGDPALVFPFPFNAYWLL